MSVAQAEKAKRVRALHRLPAQVGAPITAARDVIATRTFVCVDRLPPRTEIDSHMAGAGETPQAEEKKKPARMA